MATNELPLSRVVDVVITRQTAFPTRRGFGTLLIATGDSTGVVDATTRTKIYTTAAEVAVDYAANTEIYKAALQAFAVKPAPLFIKIGWYDTTAADIEDELDLIEAYDADWYGLTFTSEVRDNTDVDAVAGWIESRTKVYSTCTNDVLTEDAADTTCVAHRLSLAGYDRTLTNYHTDSSMYMDVAFLARALRVNFNETNSAITMKFKLLHGITPIQRSTAAVTAITGFVPGQGLVDNAGHFANTYVTVGGRNMTTEGNMASGEFFDTVHFVDWLQDAISINVLSLLQTSNKVPYTDIGVQQIADATTLALEQGVNNGGLATSFDEEGNFIKPYQLTLTRTADTPQSQRAQRIAPPVQFEAQIANAMHYASVNGNVAP